MTQVIGESLPSDVNFSLPTEKLNGFVFSEDISWASALRKIYAASQEAILEPVQEWLFPGMGMVGAELGVI